MNHAPIVFFDTETTGMTRSGGPVYQDHRIVEVAFLRPLSLTTFEEFQQYLNPCQQVSPQALAVHGLSDEFLKSYPVFEQCAEKIVEQIKGAILIAHNAPFDLAFLDYELNRAGFGPVTSYCAEVIDTLVLARKKFPGQKNSLDALCQRFSISLANRQFHGGLKDCYLLSQVYRCLRQGQRYLELNPSSSPSETLVQSGSESVKIDSNLIRCTVSEEERAAHEKFMAKYCC